MPRFGRTIWLLSLTSLFTDMASEMLYPVMPMYLRSIGFSMVLIGVLEGTAEAVAGLSKGYFGRLSDARGRRLPFVRLGYTLSAVSKPLLAVSAWPLWVFAARTLDRLGKGVRTAPRDALLSAASPDGMRGRAFGLHRGFDTLGAALGPLCALLFLQVRPGDYRALFLVALAPGLLAVASTFAVREAGPAAAPRRTTGGFFSFLGYWREAGPQYRRVVGGLLAFTLVNSSDVFLLLMMKHRGLADATVIWVYILYNMVYAAAALPFGAMGDRIGFRPTLILGFAVFAIVYAGAAVAHTLPAFVALFALYGIYAAATEGIAKAWITSLCPASEAGTAIGFFTGVQSVFAIAASTLAGVLWHGLGAPAPFAVSAAGAVLVAAWFGGMRGR